MDSAMLGKTQESFKDDDLVVKLSNPVGKIRGHVLKSRNDNDFCAFQDVPYAQPPVGNNRFKPPKRLDDWEGILNTTSNEKRCPQLNSSTKELIGTEDCLVLNVYTPVKPGTNASLPVYFWIHGGGFVDGDGRLQSFNPKSFIDYDIIIVVINYRVGALGFLTTNDESLPGNLGLKDQHFALKWTADNIHLFGGDPQRITIGGQSAGGISVGYHLLSKQNKGLIKGVIEESGTPLMLGSYEENYIDRAFTFGKLLKPSFSSNKSSDLLEILLAATLPEILAVQEQMVTTHGLNFLAGGSWSPIIEDENNPDALVTGPMAQDFLDGKFNKVPSLIGFTSEESLLVYGVPQEVLIKSARRWDENISLIISSKLNVAEEDKQSAGIELKKIYTEKPFAENISAYLRYCSDVAFTRGMIRQAELTYPYVPVYLYKFSYDSGFYNVSDTEHVSHGDELSYFWDHPIPVNETIRKILLKLWTNFIKTQNPTPIADEELQNITWPAIKTDDFEYLNIDTTLQVETNPRQYKEVRAVLDKYIRPPYIVY